MDDIHTIDIEDLYDLINTEQTEAIQNTCINNCKNITEDSSQGIVVCLDCGQVVNSVIDTSPEWHDYDEHKDTSRCSSYYNELLPHSSMGTNIEGNNKTVLKRLQGWGAVPYRETSLKRVFNIIHDKCSKLRLYKCIEDDANIIYKKLNDMKHSDGRYKDKYIINRGTNRMGIIASCIFFACKRKNITRSPREIASVFGIRPSEVTKGCKNFRKKIYEKNINLDIGESNPEHFISRFCEELRFSEINKQYAITVGKNICKLSKSSNHTPLTIAICSIYVTTINKNIYNIDKKILSRYFNVSEITIIKTFTSLEKYINILDDNIQVEYLIAKNNFENYCSKIPSIVINKTKELQVGISSYTKKDFERHIKFLNNQLSSIDNYLEKLDNFVKNIKK